MEGALSRWPALASLTSLSRPPPAMARRRSVPRCVVRELQKVCRLFDWMHIIYIDIMHRRYIMHDGDAASEVSPLEDGEGRGGDAPATPRDGGIARRGLKRRLRMGDVPKPPSMQYSSHALQWMG